MKIKLKTFKVIGLLLVLLCIANVGCDPPKEAVIDSTTGLTPQQNQMLQLCLGVGYRGEGGYADLEYSTTSLFDPDQLSKFTEVVMAPRYDGRIAEGRSISDYANSLSVSVSVSGKYELFSGSASASFNQSSMTNNNNSFFTLLDVIGYYRLDIDAKKAPLKPAVKNDIEHMAPDQLIATYGTHYVQSAYVGARVAFNTYIDRSRFTNESDFEASVTAAYGSSVSGKVSVGSTNKEYIEEFSKNSTVQVFGGDPSLAEAIEENGNKNGGYDNWRKTLKDHMTLADYGVAGLRPISELASTPARQEALDDAIQKYLKEHGLPGPTPQIMKNSTVILRSSDGRCVSRPIFWSFVGQQCYNPKMYSEDKIGDFRVTGYFSFTNSSDPLMSNNNVNIMFKEKELVPNWPDGNYAKETNADWLNAKYLKLSGPTPAFSLYWKDSEDAWAEWIIKKVNGTDGPIYSGDEVYIYNNAKSEYLNFHDDNYLWVDTSDKIKNGNRGDDKFIWKFYVVN